MKKQYIIIIVSLFSGLSCFSQPENINLSNTLLFGGEPYLAVNPVNPENIVVAWMASDLSTGFRMSIKSKTSLDGGATWGNSFIQPHFGQTWYSADPTMYFRSDGTLYLAYIDYHESPDSGGVFITHSYDGGISWTAPVQVWDGMTEDPAKRPLDRPWVVIDNSGTSTDGMFYITTKPAPWISPPNRPYLKSSSDGGQTWSPYRYVDTTGYLVGNIIQAPMAAPAITSDGALCIAYPSYLYSQSPYPMYYLARSTDRGLSFHYFTLLTNPTTVTETNYKLGYHLAANPVNPQQMAFAFVAQTYGDADVFVSSTNDGGVTWSTPVRVNDDPQGNGKGQDMAWTDYDVNGHLVVTWRDRRNGPGEGFEQPSDTYCAVSFDNGASFQPNIRLSNVTAPYESILSQNGNDFLGCALLHDTIYSAWGDVRTGNLNIFFAKTSDSTGSGTGVIPIDEQPSLFMISPNPASERVTLSWQKTLPGEVNISLFAEQGDEIFKKSADPGRMKTDIDISGLAVGLYVIQISVQHKILFSGKLVKSK